MSATLIERGKHVEVVTKSRHFEWAHCPGAGFGFDLDDDGNVIIKNDASRANYEMCLKGEDEDGRKVLDKGILTFRHTYYDPPLYQCECGAKFAGDGDSKCKCGRWYNAGGQELDAHAMVCSVYAAGYDCMCGEND